ncbi:hypothetical protein FGW37_01875 [Streptomyces rectiverticillatus]|uniref:hypothetical protein n=1 Tax=Streptomyces rectiverticillatus TaxID=173860 RepID=UPI0015C37F84|nr:hypothetical protein [Streptomyces rectiverticillatus]QLE70516.1 hypothetical protein FGW37_01875 [Streptomyces rectiverticillatus]
MSISLPTPGPGSASASVPASASASMPEPGPAGPAGPPDPAGVPVPDLDDLRFQPLVDAAKRALPERVPEWTDHNVSDPGVTLIEACAERADQLSYRLDRMTDRQRSALLRLMGITPLPASPARVVVEFSRGGALPSRVIPEGTEVRTGDGEEAVVLCTIAALTLAEGQSSGCVEAVEQPVTYHEVLGVADGAPGGRFATSQRPWGPGAPAADPPFGPPVTVCVDRVAWPPVRTFAEAGPDTPAHWWDDAACEVVFGPLVPAESGSVRHGAVPPAGAAISAEYTAYRGSKGGVPAGTPLTVAAPAGLTAVVRTVLAPAQDAEDRRQALERAGLGLAPLRRAVTAADHEQLIEEHVGGLARVRVTALTRPTDSRVPEAFGVPERPAEVLACAVAARNPGRVVHYYDDGTIKARSLTLRMPDTDDGRTSAPTLSGETDDVPDEVQEAKCLNAVIRTGEHQPKLPLEQPPRLWFYGQHCLWDGGSGPREIREEFPGLPDAFCADLDEVAVLADPDTPDAYELFFFKGETFYHRAYTVVPGGRGFLPRPDSRGVTSRISEAFPGLSPQCQDTPDAVAVVNGVFFFMKGTRTEPALWRPEDALLHVLLVPRTDADPEQKPAAGEFDIPADVLARVSAVVDASRLLGERLGVGPPRYHSFGVTATVRPWSSTQDDEARARQAAERALRRFFHPTAGVPDGRGWPWGRRVHAGDVFTALEPLPELRGTLAVGLTLPPVRGAEDTDDGDGDSDGRAVTSVEVSDGGLVLLDGVNITVARPED